MTEQARSEAKRLRRLKRKQESGKTISKTVVGGGALAAISIAFGLNALTPSGQNDSNEDASTAPIDTSQSPTPSASPSTQPEISINSDTGNSGASKISVTTSPSASPIVTPSTSPIVTPQPSPSSSQLPAIQLGSYYDAGRYGSGYYSTAYDVAFSSPMFQAGSGSYYGTSGYDAAIDSPNGYYSQSGSNGSGFYETGYFDYSANYAGSWDGSGITFPYGSGAYYGASGYSDPIYELRGSYYASGIAGSGYYASSFTGGYYQVTDYGNSWNQVLLNVGIGTYYGISGTSAPIAAPSGSYYATGFNGAGYYSTGYFACGYGYVTGASEYNIYYGNIGRQTYYGLMRTSAPVAGPEGIYRNDGFRGSGYYEPTDPYENQYRFGTGSYYGTSGYGTPVAPPTGQWFYTGWGGSGFYSTGQSGTYWFEGIGTGAYYGSSGNSTALEPA